MRRIGGVLAATVTAAGFAGCGEEERPEPPRAHSPKVALTLEWPGAAPAALITFQRDDGRRCHALGSLTSRGPRLMGVPDVPIAEAVADHPVKCLAGGRGGVSVDVRGAPGGRIIGGLAAPGVKWLSIGDQRIRPAANGAFLVHRSDGETTARRVRIELRDGKRTSLPLPLS